MTPDNHHEETSITHIWNRFHVRWLLCGGAAGIGAGLVMLVVAILLGLESLGEWSQPMKLLAAGIFGPDATYYGPLGEPGLYGTSLHLSLSLLYGMLFAQLVDEKSRKRSIIVLGLVTSFIIWIFGSLLFMPSFNRTLAGILPARVGLLLHLVFGLSFGLILSALRPRFLSSHNP